MTDKLSCRYKLSVDIKRVVCTFDVFFFFFFFFFVCVCGFYRSVNAGESLYSFYRRLHIAIIHKK